MVEFQVRCKECNDELTTEFETIQRYPHDIALIVAPCSKCLEATLEEGRLAGIKEGSSEVQS